MIMFVVPLFNINSYQDTADAWDYTTTNIKSLLLADTIDTDAIEGLINNRLTDFLQ